MLREQRWKRQRELGIVDGALSPRDPKTIPDWNLPETELKQRIGPGEVGHAVAWDELTDEQKDVPGDEDGDPRRDGRPDGPRDRPRARAAQGDRATSTTR